jgi:hypothetical protein
LNDAVYTVPQKWNEAVDFKMAAKERVWENVVVIGDCLMEEYRHVLEKKKKK